MTTEEKLNAAEALIKSLESGIKIVNQTFYGNPPPVGMTKERTEAVVRTMLWSVDLYREHAQ